MWWMTGSHQIDPDEDQGDEGWTTLRYRKVYRQFLIPRGLGSLPLVVTECGIDPMVNPKPQGAPSAAWKDLGKFWSQHDGETDKADFYFRQLRWYDEELQKDDYVAGATIFTYGSFGPPWSDVDIAGTAVSDKLRGYVQSDPAHPFSYPEEGPVDGDTVPSQFRGRPRVQYRRTYVLLPPSAGAEWARAIVDSTWDSKRYTVGGSADDAGIGDLDERRIIAVNPAKWSTETSLEAFFEEHYPGVAYISVTASTPAELARILSREDVH
jgi:hypothetical protein